MDELGQWRAATWAAIRINASSLAAVHAFDSGGVVKGQIGQESCYIEESR